MVTRQARNAQELKHPSAARHHNVTLGTLGFHYTPELKLIVHQRRERKTELKALFSRYILFSKFYELHAICIYNERTNESNHCNTPAPYNGVDAAQATYDGLTQEEAYTRRFS